MSLGISISSIRSQGEDVPSHTAALGMLYLRTSTAVIYRQTEGPAGNVWRVVGGVGIASWGDTSIAIDVRKGMNREP